MVDEIQQSCVLRYDTITNTFFNLEYPLGQIDDICYKLIVSGSDIYAGGDIVTSGAYGFAKWSTTFLTESFITKLYLKKIYLSS